MSKSAKRRVRRQAKKLAQIEDKKKQVGVPTMNPIQVAKVLSDPSDIYHAGLTEVLSYIDQITQSNYQKQYALAGLKVVDHVSQSVLNKHFYSLSLEEKRKLLHYILADDLGSIAVSALRHIGPQLASYVWNKVKDSKLGQKASRYLKEYFGVDTNDDAPLSQATFSIQPNQASWLVPTDVSFRLDAVNVQAIASMLFPEYTSCRIPSDVALKSGLVNRSQAFTVTTNASGAAGVRFLPQLFDQTTGFLTIFNDATFNPATGSQTPAVTGLGGPLAGLGSTISTVRLTGFSVVIQPIVSTLNNSGRIVYNMSDIGGTVPNPNGLQYNTTTCRDAQYCLYGSMQGSSGHRLVYDNSSVADESFTTFATAREIDVVQMIFEGCAPNVAVAQIQYNYQLEYTVLGGASILIDKQTPPIGPSTIKCFDAALSLRPDLRIIGVQESKQLYAALAVCPPYYQDVLRLLTGFNFSHSYSETIIQRNQPQNFDEADSFQSPILATM